MTTYDDLMAEYAAHGYSKADALFFCRASRLAYAQRDGAVDLTAIETQTQAWQFEGVETFEVVRGWDVDTQGYVAYGPERVLIAFRGTESGRDWRTNLQAVTDPAPGTTRAYTRASRTRLRPSLFGWGKSSVESRAKGRRSGSPGTAWAVRSRCCWPRRSEKRAGR